ncbi:MAG TPA: hypothetical protein VGA22_04035 [Gemmatimonadales bacterium]|jgi:hypothetical protein
MTEPVYDPKRARQLVELLRALADRIRALEGDAALLDAGPELLRMMGDARSELFHYEVRRTYDTPEIAESRRIVEDAVQRAESADFSQPYSPEEGEDDEPWGSR